jgi:hypothetical protein
MKPASSTRLLSLIYLCLCLWTGSGSDYKPRLAWICYPLASASRALGLQVYTTMPSATVTLDCTGLIYVGQWIPAVIWKLMAIQNYVKSSLQKFVG